MAWIRETKRQNKSRIKSSTSRRLTFKASSSFRSSIINTAPKICLTAEDQLSQEQLMSTKVWWSLIAKVNWLCSKWDFKNVTKIQTKSWSPLKTFQWELLTLMVEFHRWFLIHQIHASNMFPFLMWNLVPLTKWSTAQSNSLLKLACSQSKGQTFTLKTSTLHQRHLKRIRSIWTQDSSIGKQLWLTSRSSNKTWKPQMQRSERRGFHLQVLNQWWKMQIKSSRFISLTKTMFKVQSKTENWFKEDEMNKIKWIKTI